MYDKQILKVLVFVGCFSECLSGVEGKREREREIKREIISLILHTIFGLSLIFAKVLACFLFTL